MDEACWDPADSDVQATLSPAVDILISGNLECLLWYLEHESSSNAAPNSARQTSARAMIDSWMKSAKTNGRVEVPVEVLELGLEGLLG